jgi:hypothetical protein
MNATGRIFGLIALLLAALIGCSAPDFVTDGPFSRSLKEFRRIEIRHVRVSASAAADEPWVQEFARDLPRLVLRGLHRRGILDAPAGPILVLEARIVKGDVVEASDAAVDASLEVAVAFRDEAGALVGNGTVTAPGSGSSPRSALESAGNGVVASITKFLRKRIAKDPDKDVEKILQSESVPSN